MKLWEVKHPYYCSESNYFDRGYSSQYNSWEEFLELEGDNDPDLNFVFRWDWKTYNAPDSDEYDPDEPETNEFQVCYVLQRKGIYRPVTVKVNREDEPKIREWLKSKMELMKEVWEPFS